MEPSPELIIASDAAARTVTLTLNRPARRNALHLPLLLALREAVAGAPDLLPRPRLLILRGAGPAFCSGMDLNATGGDPHATAEGVRDVLLALANCPLVTVAAVHGHAVAGGVGLVAACDFAWMAEEARIGLPEVKRGLVPALVNAFLRRQLRERDLRELLLLGEMLPARRALEIGLVSRVVPAAELDAGIAALAASLAGSAPGALAGTKRLLRELAPRSLEDDCRLALETHRAARGSAEAREGAAAFLEKRPPRWETGEEY